MPDRLELVKGAPAVRRAHLDQLVSALWPLRATRPPRILAGAAQRNALLARIRAGRASRATLGSWDRELAVRAIALRENRAAAAALLAEPFASRASRLGLSGEAALEYRPRSRAEGRGGVPRRAERAPGIELERGFSAHGPHRDELLFSGTGASCARSAHRASSAWHCSRCCWPSATCSRAGARADAADAARRRHVRARLRAPRAAGGRALQQRAERDRDDRSRARAGCERRHGDPSAESRRERSFRRRWRREKGRPAHARECARRLTARRLAPATTLARVQECWERAVGRGDRRCGAPDGRARRASSR